MKSKKKMPKYNSGGYNDPEKLKKLAKAAFNSLTGVGAIKGAMGAASKLNGGNVFERAGYDVSKSPSKELVKAAVSGGITGASMGKMTKTVENKEPAGLKSLQKVEPTGLKSLKKVAEGSFSKSKQSLKPKKQKGINVPSKPIPRVTSKPSNSDKEVRFESYRYGGKVYKDGGRALFEALKKKFGEG